MKLCRFVCAHVGFPGDAIRWRRISLSSCSDFFWSVFLLWGHLLSSTLPKSSCKATTKWRGVIRDLLPPTHVPSFAEEGGAVVVSTHVGGKRVPGHLVWWSTALRGSYYYTTRRRAAGCFGQIWRNPTPILGRLAGLYL